MDAYCLGYMHRKCNTCQHDANWNTLNQMPDSLRKSMQATMRRVDSDKCRLTHMGEYQRDSRLDDEGDASCE